MAAVAAMLDEQSSKGTFLQLPPMSHQKIRPVDLGVGQKIRVILLIIYHLFYDQKNFFPETCQKLSIW
jgi:hypothetical protein